MCAELASLENVEEVISPTRPYGEPIDYANVSTDLTIQSVLDDQYMRTMVGENSTAILITVVFVQEPFSPDSIESIDTIRDLVATTVSAGGMFTAGYVAGGTATMYDLSVETNDDFLLIIPVVIVAIYIVLLLVLGSVLNPLRSILTILLSISWTLAVTMVLFTYVFETPIMWMVPLMLLVVCLGLGMDYDILLSTRVREEASKGKEHQRLHRDRGGQDRRHHHRLRADHGRRVRDHDALRRLAAAGVRLRPHVRHLAGRAGRAHLPRAGDHVPAGEVELVGARAAAADQDNATEAGG